MWDNVVLVSPTGTVLTLDRTETQDYVLDIVDVGVKDTNYTILNTKGIVGVERTLWYKKMATMTITGWALCDEYDIEVLPRRKMFLNRFVEPQRLLQVTAYNTARNMQIQVPIFLTQSVRYGTNEKENNEMFCRFLITGVYRQDQFIST